MEWKVVFYSDRLEEDIQNWPKGIRASFLRIVDRLEKFGMIAMHMPHVEPLGKGLYEIRAKGKEGIGRAFYCMITGRTIVILSEYIKKTQKAPQREIELARQRMKEVIK